MASRSITQSSLSGTAPTNSMEISGSSRTAGRLASRIVATSTSHVALGARACAALRGSIVYCIDKHPAHGTRGASAHIASLSTENRPGSGRTKSRRPERRRSRRRTQGLEVGNHVPLILVGAPLADLHFDLEACVDGSPD
eukprot:1034183-Prymnesium_polylepis.1